MICLFILTVFVMAQVTDVSDIARWEVTLVFAVCLLWDMMFFGHLSKIRSAIEMVARKIDDA